MATIPMVAPNGQTGDIPVDQVPKAQQAGFKKAFVMTAPDGKSTGYIPFDRAQDAARSGFKLTYASNNPLGEGTYAMWNDAGHKLAIPYSKVSVAQAQGYKFDTNANQAGLTPSQQFQKDSAATHPGPAAAGFTPGNILRNVGTGVKQLAQGGVQTLSDIGGAVLPQSMGGDPLNNLQLVHHIVDPMQDEAAQSRASGAAGNTGDMVTHAIASGVPVLGPMVDQLGQQAESGDVGGALARAVTLAGAPKLVDAARPVLTSGIGRGLAGDVNAPIPGIEPPLTPTARYASMKAMGLQPNAAEATNSTPLNIVEKVNANSLTAAPTYTKARAQNLEALNDYTQDVLSKMSDKGLEEGGAAVQRELLQSHADLKTAATQAFEDLDSQVGDQPLPGAAGLREQAQAILDANAPYYKLHPELEPTKAMAIVRDLAGAKGSARPRPAVIPGFGPAPAAPSVEPPPVPTYSELHRLRSDLLDFNNTNPDLVKNQANGWISQLAGAADQAITSGEGALTPDQLSTFRNANEAWKFMKDTYDNPSHPFYYAVRNASPSTLVNGAAGISRTPEMVKMLQSILGSEEMGAIQRGVAENLLRTTKEGSYNFKTFQGQWNKLKPANRDALFTPEQQQQLQDIGNAGTMLHEDANPSGSARLGQGIAEGAEALRSFPSPHEMVGNAVYHGAQYGVGRLMNSPSFVDWLMRGRGFAPVTEAGSAPTAGVSIPAAVLGSGIGPAGQPNYYSDEALRARAAFDAAQNGGGNQ